jgi:long-chain acyl-CoA synthetase
MDKIWLRHYPPGTPETINPDQYHSLPAALNAFCEAYAQRKAFVNFGQSITYAQLMQYSGQLAAFFQQIWKLNPGDRIALVMPNLLQYPVAVFAALRAGLVVVNVNPLYTARELQHELLDSGAKAVIVLSNFARTLETVLTASSEIRVKHVMITQMGDLFSGIKGTVFNVIVRIAFWRTPPWQIAGADHFKTALARGEKLKFDPPVIHPQDIAFLQYTGGTTGTPKGAMLSHRNLIANMLQCVAWIQSSLKNERQTLLTALPMYHIFSLTVSCFTVLALGATAVLATDPRNLRGLVRCWRKSTPTIFFGLNTLFLHLMNAPRFAGLNFQSLKLTVGGGMATQASIAARWQQMTGCVITEGYGLTEASPVVTINPPDMTYFTRSIGLPIPATDIKICDDQSQEVALESIGELYVKGPQVMLGYWQQKSETAAVLDAQGWLKTGDMVRMDAQGFIYLVDRKKDMIIISGFNVYPSEIEAVIAAHPGVADVAVVGVPHESTGEMIKAWVVKKDPALTAEDILQECRRQLTAYKIPKVIEFKDRLPKSSIGKTLHTTQWH